MMQMVVTEHLIGHHASRTMRVVPCADTSKTLLSYKLTLILAFVVYVADDGYENDEKASQCRTQRDDQYRVRAVEDIYRV